jgi:predicted O-linked N-acetylglucosamine transferase (SPINDLY family)
MRLLREVPDSVLWLLESNSEAKENLCAAATREGADAARLVFAPLIDMRDHLGRPAHADLFLDTFPCTAHTTASDALWAGLPVLTREGETFASRVAASVLRAAGLPDLVTRTDEEYAALALGLARDRDQRTALRARLAANRQTSALFDTPNFTRNIEALYVRMVERQRAGAPPDHLRA